MTKIHGNQFVTSKMYHKRSDSGKIREASNQAGSKKRTGPNKLNHSFLQMLDRKPNSSIKPTIKSPMDLPFLEIKIRLNKNRPKLNKQNNEFKFKKLSTNCKKDWTQS